MAQTPNILQILQHFLNVLTKQFICYEGRMSKLDYIAFIIPALIVEYILSATIIGYLVFLIPTACAAARRLHDIGMSGWIALLMIIPILNILLTVFLCIQEGQKTRNAYGEVPFDNCVF